MNSVVCLFQKTLEIISGVFLAFIKKCRYLYFNSKKYRNESNVKDGFNCLGCSICLRPLFERNH